MSQAIRVGFEELRSLASGSIGASYSQIGTSFAFPLRMLIVENLTDALLTFSLDGVTDHFVLPANGPLVLDFTSNRTQTSGFLLSQGKGLYVKENGTPSTGSVYVSSIYGQE